MRLLPPNYAWGLCPPERYNMSAGNFCDSSVLDLRGQRSGVTQFYAMPAGVKKAVKRTLHRRTRQTETRALKAEDLSTLDLTAKSPAEYRLFDLCESDDCWTSVVGTDPDNEDLNDVLYAHLAHCAEEAELDLPYKVSAAELGGMPDWMVAQLEATGGSAMEMLSILEAKPVNNRNRNKMFAVAREDDGYCED